MDIIAYAIPFFLVAIVLEIIWGRTRGLDTYRLNDTFSSLMLGIMSQARKFVLLGIGGWVYQQVTDLTVVALWPANAWVTWLVAFVLYDFCYYWLHRLGHERQILWAAHVVHHQSEDYNLATALRQTSTGFLLGWLFYIPMYIVGIPAQVIVTVGAINLIYQFWVHTQHVPELGWFEWFFVSPSNHRVHHAQNDRYLDRNYGGVFIVWDRLFGTYQRELPDVPCIYGIRGAIRTWNPLVALTHIYTDMVSDIRGAPHWRDRLRVPISRTGWKPEAAAHDAFRQKNDLMAFEPYDPVVSQIVKIYAGVQLLFATGLLAYGQLHTMSVASYWLWWGLLMWTGVATAAWLDARPWRYCFCIDAPRQLVVLTSISLIIPDGPWQIAGLLLAIVGAVLLSRDWFDKKSTGQALASIASQAVSKQ